MRWRDAGLFCATDQSPQHTFLLLSSIRVCAAIWKSPSSNGYVQTLDLPGFPYLCLGTAGCKGLYLQGRACTCVRNLSTNIQVACVMNKQTRKWVQMSPPPLVSEFRTQDSANRAVLEKPSALLFTVCGLLQSHGWLFLKKREEEKQSHDD